MSRQFCAIMRYSWGVSLPAHPLYRILLSETGILEFLWPTCLLAVLPAQGVVGRCLRKIPLCSDRVYLFRSLQLQRVSPSSSEWKALLAYVGDGHSMQAPSAGMSLIEDQTRLSKLTWE